MKFREYFVAEDVRVLTRVIVHTDSLTAAEAALLDQWEDDFDPPEDVQALLADTRWGHRVVEQRPSDSPDYTYSPVQDGE